MELERIALSDPYFVQRKLYPNVDFTGIVQRAIGIPTSLFTAIFALARTVGWIAQWNEMLSDPDYKIGRPRQLFTGSVTRDVPRWTSADPSALAQTNPPAVAGLFLGARDQALARGVEPGGPGMAGAVRSDRERVNTNSKAYAFGRIHRKQRGRKALAAARRQQHQASGSNWRRAAAAGGASRSPVKTAPLAGVTLPGKIEAELFNRGADRASAAGILERSCRKHCVLADSTIESPRKFIGKYAAKSIDDIEISRMSSPRHVWEREATHMRKDSNEAFLLTLMESGIGHLSQSGRSTQVNNGDIALYDAERRFTYDVTPESVLLLRIPRKQLLYRAPRPSATRRCASRRTSPSPACWPACCAKPPAQISPDLPAGVQSSLPRHCSICWPRPSRCRWPAAIPRPTNASGGCSGSSSTSNRSWMIRC